MRFFLNLNSLYLILCQFKVLISAGPHTRKCWVYLRVFRGIQSRGVSSGDPKLMGILGYRTWAATLILAGTQLFHSWAAGGLCDMMLEGLGLVVVAAPLGPLNSISS